MSNFIPMVSASPPPFDDHSFGYDDDDDFGTFTGADDSHESSPGPPEPLPFEPDLDNIAPDESTKNNNPEINNLNDTNKNVNANKVHPQEPDNTKTLVNGTEDSEDFANFKQYDEGQKKDPSVKKPHIENLPIQSVSGNSTVSDNIENENVSESKDLLKEKSGSSPENGSCDYKSPTCDKDVVQSSITGSRDSTTDSGMFSTDISPVPKSEDTAEICDRSCDSDNDDTFPDLPKDKSESIDSLPVNETDDFTPRLGTPDTESVLRTSPVLETCSNLEVNVSEASKEDSSSVSQTKVEEGDATLNKDDQTISCSSTDQQVSQLDSRDDSQLLSEQNEKSSQDLCLGQVDNNEEDEDDWGDFDAAGIGAQEDEVHDKDQVVVEEGNSQSDMASGSGTNSAYADTQSEDDCLEAIDEALRDSENIDVTEVDEPDNEVVSVTEVSDDKSKFDSVANVCESSDSPDHDTVEKSSQVDRENCDTAQEQRTDFGCDTESNQDKICAERTSESPQDTQEDKSGEFVARDDEWNAFGDFSETGGDGGDNWADFHTPTSSEPAQTVHNTADDCEEDSDFGDFSTAKQSSNQEDVKDTPGGFTGSGDKDVFKDDGGDWADFEESSTPSVQASQAPVKPSTSDRLQSVPESHSKVSHEQLEQVLSSCFPSSDTRDVVHSSPSHLEVLIAAQQQQGTLSMHISKKISPRAPGIVWRSLQDLDKTNALVYQWSSSAANNRMFKTLHIDTQNMLFGHKKQSVPIFASNIGLLEPIRGSASAKPLQPRPSPTLVDPDKADDHAGGSQELPPVEFDWDNSGLTNPLTAEGSVKQSPVYGEPPGPVISGSMSKTLDLDFLSVQETENVNKNTVFQSEILDAPRSSVKSLPPLEDILKNMKTTTTTRRRQDEHLSEEAGRIIDSLPLLSFMTSKVLMFPLRQAND